MNNQQSYDKLKKLIETLQNDKQSLHDRLVDANRNKLNQATIPTASEELSQIKSEEHEDALLWNCGILCSDPKVPIVQGLIKPKHVYMTEYVLYSKAEENDALAVKPLK